jgi:proline iminopeptidase
LLNPLLAFALLFPALHAAQHHTGFVHTQQVDLGYETFGTKGSALPIIVVNGGPGLSHAYMLQNDLWQRLSAQRLVVFYDQRGTGESKLLQPNAPQIMDAQVADLDAVRAALHLDRIALLGDSYGGLLSMAYASAHPEHVAKLILSDSPGPSWKSIVHLLPQVFPDQEEKGDAEEKSLATNPGAAAQAGLVNHFRMIFYSASKRDAYLARMGDIGFVPGVANAIQQASADLDLTDKLPTFRFPTLILTGRFDMNVAPITAWRMLSLLLA